MARRYFGGLSSYTVWGKLKKSSPHYTPQFGREHFLYFQLGETPKEALKLARAKSSGQFTVTRVKISTNRA